MARFRGRKELSRVRKLVGIGQGRVVVQSGEDDVLGGLLAVTGAGDDPSYALPAKSGSGRDPQGRLVPGSTNASIRGQPKPSLAGLGHRPVGQHPDGSGGVPASTMPGIERPREHAGVVVLALDLARAHELPFVLDREVGDAAAFVPGPSPVHDGGDHPIPRRLHDPIWEPEPVSDLLVVPGHGGVDVPIGPRPKGDQAVGQRRLVVAVGHLATLVGAAIGAGSSR